METGAGQHPEYSLRMRVGSRGSGQPLTATGKQGIDCKWSWIRSPACSPFERIHGGDRDRTSSISINPIKPIHLITHNLRVKSFNCAPSRCTWINHQRANGIQEVVGSIPIGSTRLRIRTHRPTGGISFSPPPHTPLEAYIPSRRSFIFSCRVVPHLKSYF